MGSIRKKKDGPRQLPRAIRTVIVERLRDFVNRHYASQRQFGLRIGASSGTTSRWFGRDGALPDAPALYRIANEAKISLDWLMTGEGSEIIGLAIPLGGLGETLREAHISWLVHCGVGRAEAERFTPDGSVLVTRTLRRHVEDWNAYSKQMRLREKMWKVRPHTIATALEDFLAELR